VTSHLLLRKDELPVGDHVELAFLAGEVGCVVSLCP
jgi:hypothetical protein